MENSDSDSHTSDNTDFLNIWDVTSRKNDKKMNSISPRKFKTEQKCNRVMGGKDKNDHDSHVDVRRKKFEELKERAKTIQTFSKLRQLKTQQKRADKLIKKAMKDPTIKNIIQNKDNPDEKVETIEEPKEKWDDIKPFLNVNDHLHGPISHGSCGPKTELETLIDGYIEEGDFKQAEILSDNLSNREFAVKITTAFSAKRCAVKMAEEAAEMKAKRSKKLHWGFEAKERWQQKGNM